MKRNAYKPPLRFKRNLEFFKEKVLYTLFPDFAIFSNLKFCRSEKKYNDIFFKSNIRTTLQVDVDTPNHYFIGNLLDL